jgi:hypothetical protein
VQAQGKLQDAIEGSMNGLTNSHRVKVLEEGVQLHTVGVPAEDAQFLESQDWGAHQVARLYRMPPHKIGLLKNATFSNIEHQAIEYVTDTLQPWLVRHEQALQRDLLTETEQQQLFFEYLVEGALRGDIRSRYEAYAVGRNWGWFSANDIRERENLNPIDGGDVYLTPLNMSAGQMPPAQQRSGALLRLYEDATGRLQRREMADLRRGVDKHLRRGSTDDFKGWLQEFYQELSPVAVDVVQPVVDADMHLRGGDVRDAEQHLRGWITNHFTKRWAAFEDALIDEDAPAAVDRLLADLERQGSEMGSQLAEEIEQLCN